MPESAFQIQYRQEFVQAFEQRQSLVRNFVTTEAVIKGQQATFLVAGSGNASAVTRGLNGLIPARADDLNQYTATMAEWHDLVRKTGFNVFASQGDQRAIMQQTTMGVINRKIDQDIITELNTATNDTGAATTASLNLVIKAKAILGNNKVAHDGGITALVSPAFMGYLTQTKEFASADYVSGMPMETGAQFYSGVPGFYKWLGINFVEHPELPGTVGVGASGSAEKCFMFHRNAIGHAMDKEGLKTPVGYDDEQDYSFARASAFMGAKLLQNSGVVVMNHDGSAFVAT